MASATLPIELLGLDPTSTQPSCAEMSKWCVCMCTCSIFCVRLRASLYECVCIAVCWKPGFTCQLNQTKQRQRKALRDKGKSEIRNKVQKNHTHNVQNHTHNGRRPVRHASVSHTHTHIHTHTHACTHARTHAHTRTHTHTHTHTTGTLLGSGVQVSCDVLVATKCEYILRV
jgi:hypothetical protein